MEEKRLNRLERFIQEKLPAAEKERVILIVEGKSLTWKQVLEELKKGGSFAEKVEKKFEEMIK